MNKNKYQEALDNAENYIQIPHFEAEELKKQRENILRGNVENE